MHNAAQSVLTGSLYLQSMKKPMPFMLEHLSWMESAASMNQVESNPFHLPAIKKLKLCCLKHLCNFDV